MFKDTQEELQRLEAELLQEEAAEREEAEQDALLDDPADFGEDTPEIYQNYSNQYGRIKAYNTDVTDEDLEAYSEEVYRPRKKNHLLVLSAIVLALIAGILAVLAYWAVRLGGI